MSLQIVAQAPAMVTRRLLLRFKRRALSTRSPAYLWWRFAANGLRTCRALFMRVSHEGVPAIAQELSAQGIVVGPSDRFLTESGRRALAEVSAEVLQKSRSEAVEALVTGAALPHGMKKDFRVDLISPSDGLPAGSALMTLAVDEKLLQIVSSYLGMWPALYSAGAWLNYPTGAPPESSQLWHRDPEDIKIIKAFIYLADVDERCGPFTYIPTSHPFGAAAARSQKQRLSDEAMSRFFRPAEWRTCTGPAHTMILADTVGYHRGGKPCAGRRILVTVTYTSGTALTGSSLWIQGTPAPALTAIQRYALKDLALNRKAAAAMRKAKK